jgi:tRNA(Ile)-lysidine synthase
MCLLHLLYRLAEKGELTIFAAHLDHGLRAASAGDGRFVSEYCGERGIPLTALAADAARYARENKLGVEEAGRRLRYAFFDETARKYGAGRIATAHTASDNAETVILNLTRGAGTKGLCGIPPVRGNIIRPLLCATREEIVAYLDDNGVPHVEDLSNESDEYTRNRVRHHIIPELCAINPRFVETIAAHTELLARDEAFMDRQADIFLSERLRARKIPAAALLAAPRPIVSRALRKISGRSLEDKHIDAVLSLCGGDNPSGSVRLPAGVCRREYGDIIFGDAQPEGQALAPLTLKVGETAEIPELNMAVSCEKAEFVCKVNKSFNTFLFAKDKLCGNIVVRSRISGDRISLKGRGGTKTLKKLFIDEKTPRSRRSLIPVIADDRGPIAVYGLGQETRTLPGSRDECILVSFV